MLEINKIYNENCIGEKGMKLIPSNSINLIICDLPYGTTENKWDTIIPFNKLWEQYNRIIKNNGAIILFSSQPFTTDLIISNREMFRYEIIWEKSIGYNPLLCKKQPLKVHENICVFYKDLSEIKNSINNYIELRNYFKEIFDEIGLNKKQLIAKIGSCVDHCFRFNSSQWSLPIQNTYNKIQETFNLKLKPYKSLLDLYNKENEELNNFTYNPQMTKGKVRNKKPIMYGDKDDTNWGGAMKDFQGTENVNDEYYPRSVIYFLNANQKDKIHPTEKPVKLIEWLVKTYSQEKDLVLDNCMGSGATAIGCINTNRNYIGFELDKEYFDLANERINKIK